MNTTEQFREMCRNISEENYGRIFRYMEKEDGHKPKLPKNPPIGKVSKYTVQQRILRALKKGGEKTTRQLAHATNKTDGHIAGEMTKLFQSGAVIKRVQYVGAAGVAHWSIKTTARMVAKADV